MKTLLISLLVGACVCSTAHSSEEVDWDEIINTVNNNNGASWTAGYNFPRNVSRSYLKLLQGTQLQYFEEENVSRPSFLDEISDDHIPAKFDARTKWHKCKDTINHIRDQGSCGSCWAVASASAFTDELCIAGKLKNKIQVASEDVLGCTFIGGCYGGLLVLAWLHMRITGSVTGGDFHSNQGCLPYSIQPCAHHGGSRTPCQGHPAKTPRCPSNCKNNHYRTPFKQDKHYLKHYFTVKGEKDIQKAILANGPVVAGFLVYEDFPAYKSGVYHHVTGNELGGHAVKIIGWGTEKNKPYWLVANSWNTDWGNKGFFKILRGKDECQFERGVYGGIV